MSDQGLTLRIPDSRVIPEFESVTERYFSPNFCLGTNVNDDYDKCLLIHSNRICLVSLSPSHPILNEKKVVSNVNFEITDSLNRLHNKVTGKGKKGGQKLEANSVLCSLTCSDGSTYKIVASIRGQLIEVNESLVAEPSLLLEYPWSKGYIAVIMINLRHKDTVLKEFISLEEFKKIRQIAEHHNNLNN